MPAPDARSSDQLDAGMGLYNGFYRWARDATAKTHRPLAPPPDKEA